jgi:hypothetical protein
MYSLPIIEGLSQDDATMQLLSDIKSFNSAYQKYTSCNSATINPSNSVLNCNASELSPDTVTAAYNKLVSSTGSFTQFQAVMKPSTDNSNIDIDKNAKIMDYYNAKVVQPRGELEEKMQILKDTENSVEKDYSIKYDSTMVTNTLVTITASCMLFYVFLHIN